MAVSLLVLGGGSRGMAYARHALALGARVAALAEPRPERRQAFREAFGLEERALFAHWRDLLEAPRLGEAAIVALPDRLHAEAAIALMEKGYHLLLEKPIAPTWEEEALYAHRLAFLAEEARRAGGVVETEEGPRP